MEAARKATAWILTEGPLTQSQGWTLVSLQRPESGHEEAHVWKQVRSWARRLSEAAEQEGQGVGEVVDDAVLTMRGWLEEALRYAAEYGEPEEYAAVRTRLRDFIDTHGQTGLVPASD